MWEVKATPTCSSSKTSSSPDAGDQSAMVLADRAAGTGLLRFYARAGHQPTAAFVAVRRGDQRNTGFVTYCLSLTRATNGPSLDPALAMPRLTTYAATMPAKSAHAKSLLNVSDT